MATVNTPSAKSLSATRAGIWLVFFSMGIVSMAWVPRIPEIKKMIGLNDGQFGLILVAGTIGAGIGSQLSGRFIHTFGTRIILRIASTTMSAAVICMGLSHSALALASSLFLMGFSYSNVDVSSNTQAVALEKLMGKRVMVSFHAAWSLGTLAVSFLGALAIKHLVTPKTDLIVVGVVALFIYHASIFTMLGSEFDEYNLDSSANQVSEVMNEAEAIGETAVAKESASEKSSAKIAWFGKAFVPLWWLGLGAVGSLIPEGSVADWTGILLHENYNYTKVVSASAFTVFAVAMIISRLGGDFFLHKFGGEKTMRIGGLLAGLAMGFGILFARFTHHSHPAIALVVIDFSFFCGGIGIGPMFPYFMLAAGSIKDVPPAIGISRVGAIGISSYFIGPSVIGALAQTFTLPYALMYPIILLTSVGIFAKKMVPSE